MPSSPLSARNPDDVTLDLARAQLGEAERRRVEATSVSHMANVFATQSALGVTAGPLVHIASGAGETALAIGAVAGTVALTVVGAWTVADRPVARGRMKYWAILNAIWSVLFCLAIQVPFHLADPWRQVVLAVTSTLFVVLGVGVLLAERRRARGRAL